jgi:hypothetical protein
VIHRNIWQNTMSKVCNVFVFSKFVNHLIYHFLNHRNR